MMRIMRPLKRRRFRSMEKSFINAEETLAPIQLQQTIPFIIRL